MKFQACFAFFLVVYFNCLGQQAGKLNFVGDYKWVKKGIIQDGQPLPLKTYKRKVVSQVLPMKPKAIKSRDITLVERQLQQKLSIPPIKALRFSGEPLVCKEKILATRFWFKDVSEYNLTYTDWAHGFVSNSVVCITEDPQHNMWFATSNRGLVKFDGLNYYLFESQSGILSNSLTSVCYQSKVGLWVSSIHGVCLIRNDSVFTPSFVGLENRDINSDRITLDGKGGVWVASRAHGALRIKDGRTVQHFGAECGLGTNFIMSVHEDKVCNIWFGSKKLMRVDKGGHLTEYSVEKDNFVENQILRIVEDEDGLWVGTFSNGVLNIKGNKVKQYSLYENFGGRVFDICKARNGHWFAFFGGGLCFLGKDKSILISEKNGLCGSTSFNLFVDSYKNIWNACMGYGICRLNNSPLIPDPKLPAYLGTTISIKRDHQGQVWHLINGDCMAMQKDNEIETYTNEAIKPIPSVRHFMDAAFLKDGTFWTATYANGIAYCDKKNFTFYQYSDLPDDMVVVESEIGTDGTVWFNASTFGLIYFKKNQLFRIKTNDALLNIRGLVMDKDAKGAVLIGFESGLQKIIADTVYDLKLTKGKLDFQPTCFFTTAQGQRVIGTAGNGLLVLDGPKLYQLDSLNNKPIETIYTVLIDKSKRVWLKTANGLLSFILDNGSASQVQQFGPSYSLPITKLSGGDYVDAEGNAHWSVENGYLSYDSSLGNAGVLPPKFAYGEIKINTETLTQNATLKLYPDDLLSLNYSLLWYGNENEMQQDYVLVNTQNADTLSYGISQPGVITVRELKAGNYKLLLRAKNNNLNYFSSPILLEVLPFWYQANWFFLVLVSVIIAAIIAYFKYRQKLKENENKKLEIAVAKRTIQLRKEKQDLDIANRLISEQNKEKDALIQEIHHRVKNNLHFITGLITMQMNTESSTEGKQSLEEIERRLQAMSLVHELLYINTNVHSISALNYFLQLVNSLRVVIGNKMEQVEVIFDIDSININANSAIYLGMITSELVSNSVKYAFEGILEPLITISMKRGADNEQLFLIIKDNGIGQSLQEPKQNGMGLRLVDIFSRQLQGTYDIDKKNGFDYRLSFQLKDS